LQAAVRAPAGIAVAMALVVVVATGCSRDEQTPGGIAPPEPTPSTTPDIKQANWKFETFKTATTVKLRKRDLARFRAQRARTKEFVRDLYDALFLTPEDKGFVVEKRFTTRAARSLLGSRAGMPARAERVKTLMRKARIGIQPTALRRAAATVSIRARGVVDGERMRVVHRSTLWLERSRHRWKVIAFEIDQERIR
jgi:hypothetical protein